MGKTITEPIQAFTERGITRHMWNGSTSILDQNVSVDNILSNPHCNNGVSKVLGILLSDFVSRGSEHFLWRHHGHENQQLKPAQCQRKVSAVSGRHICMVWHSAGISGKCRDIGIDFSGIAAWPSWAQVMACCLSGTKHYLNPCWLIVNWTPINIFQLNLIQNWNVFNPSNKVENVVYKM